MRQRLLAVVFAMAISSSALAQPKRTKPIQIPNGVLFLDPAVDTEQIAHLGVWQNARKPGVYMLGMHGERGGLLSFMTGPSSDQFLDRLASSPVVRRSPLTFLAICYGGTADDVFEFGGSGRVREVHRISAAERWHAASGRPVLGALLRLKTADFRVWDAEFATLDGPPPAMTTTPDNEASFVYIGKHGKSHLITRSRALKIAMRAGWIGPLADPAETVVLGGSQAPRGFSIRGDEGAAGVLGFAAGAAGQYVGRAGASSLGADDAVTAISGHTTGFLASSASARLILGRGAAFGGPMGPLMALVMMHRELAILKDRRHTVRMLKAGAAVRDTAMWHEINSRPLSMRAAPPTQEWMAYRAWRWSLVTVGIYSWGDYGFGE